MIPTDHALNAIASLLLAAARGFLKLADICDRGATRVVDRWREYADADQG